MSLYLIAHIGHTLSNSEHICWWKPVSKGYTICIDKAGTYSEEEARAICQSSQCIAVPVPVAEPLVQSTPFYRLPDGQLALLYDGGPHRPVPNLLTNWKTLLAGRLEGCAHPEKPMPIGKKASAIYLPKIGAAA